MWYITNQHKTVRSSKKAGRPPWSNNVMTPDKLKELEGYFMNWLNDTEVCLMADISLNTLNAYYAKNPEFKIKKEILKHKPSLVAKLNLTREINKQNVDISKWRLERKNRDEFATKSETDNKNTTLEVIELTDKQKELIAKRYVPEDNK